MNKIRTYDLEVFCNYFVYVDKDSKTGVINTFELSEYVNQIPELMKYLKSFNKKDALVGFNNIGYDWPIIDFIIRNSSRITSNAIYNKSRQIIDTPRDKSWSNIIKNPKIKQIDLFKIWHFNNKNRSTSLKWLEFQMDFHKIQDLPYDFNSPVNRDQQKNLLLYCINDVEATSKFYEESKGKIKLREVLSKKYNLDLTNKPDSSIGSDLMLELYCNKLNLKKSEVLKKKTLLGDIPIKPLLFNYIKFKTPGFQKVLKTFEELVVTSTTSDFKAKKSDKFEYVYKNDIDYVYALGGIHSSDKGMFEAGNGKIIIDSDVRGLYPSIAIANGLYPKHLDPSFPEIYDKDIVSVRITEKSKPKAEQDSVIIDGYKLSANSIFGKSNDDYSWLKDYSYTLATTINGQLLLSMLAESVLEIKSLKVIQLNTDGISVLIDKKDEEMYQDKCTEWEGITKLVLEHAEYDKMCIRDVNNYISIYTDGRTKLKGCFQKDYHSTGDWHKNSSQKIVAIALEKYFTKNISVSDTIKNHTNIYDFCIGKKKNKKQWYETLTVNPNGSVAIKRIEDKVIRFFVSKESTKLYKYGYISTTGNLRKSEVSAGRSCTVFQQYEKKPMEEYRIDYNYYIKECNKIINEIKPLVTQFKLL